MMIAEPAILIAYVAAAIGLLGSPGPAIAALLAVGKVHGLGPGLRFYGGLQVGLASAAAISAAGLVSLITAAPGLQFAMVLVAVAYLIYLAWKIATAPVGKTGAASTPVTGGLVLAGAVLGLTNPKAYVAFAALMAPVTLVADSTVLDATVKWALVVAVMAVVDMLWLLGGVWLGKASLPPRIERLLNIILAAMVLGAAVLAML